MSISSGWRISDNAINYIKNNLKENSSILEFGSGYGTEILSKNFNMISIENDPEWIGRFNSRYISCPIIKYTKEIFPYSWNIFEEKDHTWYDPKVLKEVFDKEKINYDFIIVDGPKGWRLGMLDYLDVFDLDKPILFDDIHDERHFKLMQEVSLRVGKDFIVYTVDNVKEFGVIK